MILSILFGTLALMHGVMVRIRLPDGTVRRIDCEEKTSSRELRSLLIKEGLISGHSEAKLRVQTGTLSGEDTSLQLKVGEIIEVVEVSI